LTGPRDRYRRGWRSGLIGSVSVIGSQGVAVHRPDESGYNRADTYVIDDRR
jgi:hypothetical protein